MLDSNHFAAGILCWLGWHRHDQHVAYWADGAGLTEREYCASCGHEFRCEVRPNKVAGQQS